MAPKLSKAAARRARLVPLTIVERSQQCVAYGRVSTDSQREAETINHQKAVLIKDITVRDDPSLPVSSQRKLVGEFWDDGVSGTLPLDERPEGRKLLNLICNRGKLNCRGDCGAEVVVDAVWITKLDRLARRLQVLIEIEQFLSRHGVALRCLEHDINTATPLGQLIFTILGAINQWEREVILERTANGRRQKASEGKFVGGRRTFGFKTENGYLVIDDEAIEGIGKTGLQIVKEIFDNVAYHDSSAWREAQRFNMTERRVQNILHNPRYKGEFGMLADGGTQWIASTRDLGEPVVSPETWDLAQTALLDNRRNASRNRHYDYLLSQLLVCCEPWSHVPVLDEDGVKMGRNPKAPGMCGRNFIGRTDTRRQVKAKYSYYFCTRSGCTARMLRAREIEERVWELVADANANPEKYLTEALVRRDNTQAISDLRAEITSVTNHLAELDAERENVMRMFEKRRRTEAETDRRLDEIDAEISPLQDHHSALKTRLRSLTLSASDIARASITSADIDQQLVDIETMANSADAAEAHKGRLRKAALIRATVNRIEVRTGPERESIVDVYIKHSRALPIELRVSSESSDNQHHSDGREVGFDARSGATASDQPQEEDIVTVQRLVIPRPSYGPNGWKHDAA